ncbi:MAG: NUDIX domain-containing protein [Defluviitaleaceae bacterium]|nr:NUDIX domain-containing protein [Defluviitaleaceae bacterium]
MEYKFHFYPLDALGNYKFADIVALHNGKWIFCKHKERTTWEAAGGHIELGETPLEAAKRELFEETGAIDFDIEPLCDYRVRGIFGGVDTTANGQVFFANVHTLGEIPCQSEMERIELFDSPPNELTYPGFISEVSPLVLQRGVF